MTDIANSDSNQDAHFTFKDGRKYHNEAEVAYVLPNDYDGNVNIDKFSLVLIL